MAERARRMRFEEAELQRELKTLHSGESGTLTIGLSPTPASLLLSPFLTHMAANHPQVRVGRAHAGASRQDGGRQQVLLHVNLSPY